MNRPLQIYQAGRSSRYRSNKGSYTQECQYARVLILPMTHLGYTDVLQYKIAPSPILSLPASNRAFSSAWMQRQVDSAEPTPGPRLQRGPEKKGEEKQAQLYACAMVFRAIHVIHPPSLQFLVFLGVPLYPVLMTRFSRTRTQPTRLFIQLLL